ncbi:MAG: hypothetical protein A2677_04365 [Candidatus Komeilibacteria bacterium RIFCSPHIGHO2_01_FULL_52_14]|uniref:DUF378 domain-containing protein n=1 Tax=Candidatus Komeilibacteria bacterium RIFCSPHIGHO2_01_FULL_52_14 TaxID=1798549 RepID=A0A1G2BHQ7_9BACT|nr:MAG: hypothetical protein A2677_04365 [Candidatus Komeilibacteria bacterium RIFCSPHIGHO2_01_FULL_52_14]
MNEMKRAPMHKITFLLVIVGGLNWLLYGLFMTDIGTWLGGMQGMVARIIYVLVGLSAIYELAMHKQFCKQCEMMMMKKSQSGPAPTGSANMGPGMGSKM